MKPFVTSQFVEDLLKKCNSVSNHYRNLEALATEMFKVKNNIAPEIMKEHIAPKMSPFDLCNTIRFRDRE